MLVREAVTISLVAVADKKAIKNNLDGLNAGDFCQRGAEFLRNKKSKIRYTRIACFVKLVFVLPSP